MSGLSTVEFLAGLREKNVTLSVDGDRMRLNAPAGVVTAELRSEIASRKAEILKHLQEVASDNQSKSQMIPRILRDGKLPLSFAQQRLWFLAQMEGVSEAYHISRSVKLKGELNRDALCRSLDCIVSRHESLRTTFAEVDGEAAQRIAGWKESRFQLVEHDLRQHADAKAELDRITEMEVRAPFDLANGPLVRGRLIRLAEEEHVLIVTMHHIISDAWSVAVLFKELGTLYTGFSRGEGNSLPEFEVQYADYASWQREWLQNAHMEQQAAYWKNALAGIPALLELPTDHPRPAVQSFDGAFAEIKLDAQLTSRVKEFSRRHRVTPFMTLMAAWATMLERVSGQQDVVIGIPAGNRGQKEVEGLIGFFVNTLAVRLNLSGSPTVKELVEQTRVEALAALEHQDLPFENVVAITQPARSLAQSAIFQVMFAWQSATEILELPGLEVEILPLQRWSSMFDLTLYMQEAGNTITGGIEYATSLFERSRVERYLGYFRTLLQAMIADDSQGIDSLPMLSKEEEQQLLVEWNRTERDYPGDTPLAAQIESQVAKTPDHVAVIFGAESLTYRELNERANRMARELAKQGAGPDLLVGICLERSLDMMVTLLAVAKSGAGYVPMDPYLPPARLQFMMEESGMRVVVTQKDLLSELPKFEGNVVTIESEDWRKNSSENLNVAVKPEHIAYVIYTSGSTGKPKGVQIEYRALINLLWSVQDWLNFSASDRLLAVTTISFDIASADVWLPWLVGATTVLASREAAADGVQLKALMEQQKITFLQATPVTWRLLLGAGWTGDRKLQIVCTGEAMPRELATKLAPLVGKLWNLYGPTETTIWSTGCPVESGDSRVLIGRPVANTQCYILNEQRQLAPAGSVGELYIAGDGLARGYLDRPDLTAEKFVPDPFSKKAGARMYRTGDQARYMPDGNLECLGRNDHQVKIRGYRIELDEIQMALSHLPGIRQCVVVVREKSPGDPHLAAFYTVSDGTKPAVPALRAALRTSLPDYMVPNWFVELEQLPLTYNGKIDVKALPDPFQQPVSNVSQASPELAKAEAVLSKHPDLAAVVLIMPPTVSEDTRPVAFAVAKGFDEPSEIALRKHMRAHCPERLIPNKISYLPELPLDGAGAVDRTRLAETEWGKGDLQGGAPEATDEPRTEAEIALAGIWRDMLKVPRVGVNDKFFDLGGHSLLSIQLIARVERETGYRLKLRDVLMDTLGQLAARTAKDPVTSARK